MDVIVVLTKAAEHMLNVVAPRYNVGMWRRFQAALVRGRTSLACQADSDSGNILGVLINDDEWRHYSNVRSDTVLHIELRKWADICVVAPASANTIAKAAYGISDNLVTCVLRAWDFSKTLIVAPAMNTFVSTLVSASTKICVSNSTVCDVDWTDSCGTIRQRPMHYRSCRPGAARSQNLFPRNWLVATRGLAPWQRCLFCSK